MRFDIENYSSLYYVYRIRFKSHNRTYIGYTSNTPEIRFNYHWNARKNLTSPIAKCLRNTKSKEDVIVETLYIAWDKNAALDAEIELIARNKTLVTECGLNATIGGENPSINFYGNKWMEGKTDEEIAEIHKKKGMSGKRNPFYGKSHDKDTIHRMVSTRRMNESYEKAATHLHSDESKIEIRLKRKEKAAIRAGFSSDKEFVLSISDMYQKTAGSYRWIASELGANRETVKGRINDIRSGEYGDELRDYISKCDEHVEEDKKLIQLIGREKFKNQFSQRIKRENYYAFDS